MAGLIGRRTPGLTTIVSSRGKNKEIDRREGGGGGGRIEGTRREREKGEREKFVFSALGHKFLHF
jgi:hypothetical protein